MLGLRGELEVAAVRMRVSGLRKLAHCTSDGPAWSRVALAERLSSLCPHGSMPLAQGWMRRALLEAGLKLPLAPALPPILWARPLPKQPQMPLVVLCNS